MIQNKQYIITNSDILANTKAYQNYKLGVKDRNGQLLYKLASHVKDV